MGSSRLLTMKSSRSWIVVPAPRGWKSDHTLKPRTQGIDRMMIRIILITAAFFLEMWNSSILHARIFSNTAMIVEKDAKNRNRKKNDPKILPPVMDAKIFGSVLKISEGPASG